MQAGRWIPGLIRPGRINPGIHRRNGPGGCGNSASGRAAMRQKLMTAADVVAELRPGMTIGIGGWGSRRKPMALVREICRSELADLTIVSYGGPDVGLLLAAGKVRKLV